MPDISSNGFIARTASQTAAARTHTAANNKMTIANGDGVSGNPTYTINESNFTVLQAKPAEGAFADGDKTKLDNIEASADVTDATNVNAAGAVMESDYDANTVLAASSDNTPAPVTLAASQLFGRGTTGGPAALTLGTNLSFSGTTLNAAGGSSSGLTAVANIAALTAISEGGLTDGDVRWVEGFSTMNDGGQGVFVWDADNTATDVAGIIESPDTSDGTGRWVRQYSGPVNVKWFGAKGDGSTDDSGAIIAAKGLGVPVHFPAGDYKCAQTITIGSGENLIFIGDHQRNGNDSRILDGRTTPGDEPLIRCSEGWMKTDGSFDDGAGGAPTSFAVRDVVRFEFMHFYGLSGNSESSICELHNTRSSFFNNCRFENFGMRGLTLCRESTGELAFENSVINCSFVGRFFVENGIDWSAADQTRALVSWGLHSGGHTTVIGGQAETCGAGYYLVGTSSNLLGVRAETNGFGIVAGYGTYYASTSGLQTMSLSRSVIHGASMEANAIGLYAHYVASSTSISAAGVQGSAATGTRPASQRGIHIKTVDDDTCRLSELEAGGQFVIAAIENNSSCAIEKVGAANSLSAPAMAGQFSPFNMNSAGSIPPFYHLSNTLLFPAATKQRARSVTASHDLMLAGLTQLNIKDIATSGDSAGGPVMARNLGGTSAVSNAATSVAIAFEVQLASSSYAFASISAGGSGSSLPADDYWYATTVIAPNGETGILETNDTQHAHRTVTVASGEEVTMTFYGWGSKNLKRRIYRGTAKGQFTGYWEQADSATFVDDGTVSFDGYGSPPFQDSKIFSRQEEDANYQIIATPSWDTSVFITSKATTGFTINFGTAAPDANQTVAWLLFRP